ncbi:MAG: hypothetical protein GF398_11470, partial [Chitinivibrionales bacterium]|nr:hypothetical protein [Chitinivibrionales bacterium]
MLKLEGAVPGGISISFLEQRYLEIYRAIAPGERLSMAMITISFYDRSRIPDSKPMLPEWGGGGAMGL